MRSFINKIITYGTLEVIGHRKYYNVECEYEYDSFSKDNMKGKFIFRRNSKIYEYEYTNVKFNFKDKANRNIKGTIYGHSQNQEQGVYYTYFHFNIKEFYQIHYISNNIAVKAKIQYLIPYIEFFTRTIDFYYWQKEDYIIRFKNEEKRIEIDGNKIMFEEFVTFRKNIEPDSIFHKFIYPYFEFDIKNLRSDLNSIIDKSENIIEDVLLILSLIFDHYFSYFGYIIDVTDSKGKLVMKVEFRTSKYSKSKDYNESIFSVDFSKIVTLEFIQDIINSFRKNLNKDNLRTVINRFRTTTDINIFESKVIWSILSLEAISSIFKNKGRFELKLTTALKKLKLDISKYKLKENNLKKEYLGKHNKYYISNYRNDIVHSKYKVHNYKEIYAEYKKIRQLNRDMIFSCLTQKYKSFPFP